MATDRYKSLRTLSEPQLAALDVLSAGGTHQEAAEAAKKHRTTVSDWNSKHPAFIAERNRRKAERRAVVAERTDALVACALDIAQQELKANRTLEGAMSVLRWAAGAGSLGDVPVGPTSAEEVIDKAAAAVSSDASLARLLEAYGRDPGARQSFESQLAAELDDVGAASVKRRSE